MSEEHEAVLPCALFLEGAENVLAEAVLLGPVGRDPLLGQVVVGDGRAGEAGAEDQPIVITQAQACGGAAQGAEAGEDRAFERPLGGLSVGGVIQFPIEELAGASVQDVDKGAPAMGTAIDQRNVCCQRSSGREAMEREPGTRGLQPAGRWRQIQRWSRMRRWTFLHQEIPSGKS